MSAGTYTSLYNKDTMATEPSESKQNEIAEEVVPVSSHQFYFETPLYTPIDTAALPEDIWNGEVDAFSYIFKTPTTYSISTNELAEKYYTEYNDMYRVTLKNKRKEAEKLIFLIAEFDNQLIKIGQLPALATLQTAEIDEKYRKILDTKYSTFTKAIGLAAHGVGAGSLVYLRKIFAELIDESYQKHGKELSISEKEYKDLRMDGRVEALKTFLPAQLVEMKAIYGILSAGVHDLSEEDCLLYFSPLKLSIELILDEVIAEKAQQDREASVKKELQKIQESIKSR